MNHPGSTSFLRGGGMICSAQIPQNSIAQEQQFIDYEIIKQFFLDLDDECQDINGQSKSIQSQESKIKLLKIIKQISYKSQFINQASRNYAMIKEYIKQIMMNIESLLESITNTIISQRLIALQILKICNQLTRLIFQYYTNDQSIKLDLDRQQSIIAMINQIQELLDQGGDQLYYNSIYYELYIIKICIEICPTNSEEGKEVFISIISGIQGSLEELSTDLISSVAQGGLFVYKQLKKNKERNIFQIIFYLEEFKYKIIEKIQQGLGINKIIKQIVNNYNQLIKNSTEWLIKCSWIKIMSEIILYKPIITQNQFQIIKNKHQLFTDWDILIQKKIISLVDEQKLIAIINVNDENSNINRILQQQVIKFQFLQNCVINGDKNLPKLDLLKEFQNKPQNDADQQINSSIELVQNLPLEQFLQQLNEYSQQIIKYTELVQDFKEEINNQNTSSQYLLTQIEQIIAQTEYLNNLWLELLLHNNIIFDILDNIVNQFNKNDIQFSQIGIIINQIISYFELQKMLEYKFDNLQTEYQILVDKLKNLYNFEEQLQEQLNIIQNNLQFTKVDLLISKLQKIKMNNQKVINQEDIYQFIKIINIITKSITTISEKFINMNLNFMNIRSLLNTNDVVNQNLINQIQQLCPGQEYFGVMFFQNSCISIMNFIYSQIHDNQQILIKSFQNQIQESNLELNLSALQINDRIYELGDTLSIIKQQISYKFSLLKTLDDKISYFSYLQQIYMRVDMKLNNIAHFLQDQILMIEKLIKDLQLQNPNNIIFDQIVFNYKQFNQDQQSDLNIEYIWQRINLLLQLQQVTQDKQNVFIMNEVDLLKLIIEDSQQQYSNISKQDVLQIISNQQQKVIELSKTLQQQIGNNAKNEQIISYKTYILSIRQIIEDLYIYKMKENGNILIHDTNSLINNMKLLKYINNELDQNQEIKYSQIQDQFLQLYSFDLEIFRDNLQQQLSSLQQQEKKISLDLVKIMIPSYQQLNDKVLQNNNNKLSTKNRTLQLVNDYITNDEWRIKDYFYYNCMALHLNLTSSNQQIVGKLLLIARFKETDYRVINTLKGKDQIKQMEGLINNQWEETQDEVNNQIQLTLNQLQAIQLSLQSEERKDIRDQLLSKHTNLEQRLEQQMKNIDQIGDILGVTIKFLKDIKRDLVQIQNKLDNIINSLNQIGQDIKFLRGKTPQQILEIRMQNVLQNKIFQDAQSVYVQMKTLEFDFDSNIEKQEQTPLFNSDNVLNGEIDEFLIENKKSSLLIHGPAGSGKSLTSRKVEEYMWLQYSKQSSGKLWEDIKGISPLIPIFIQLPTLQEPKFNAIEETLLSSLYRFDNKQIDLLRDSAQKSQIRLIFIMDSYDELPQQYQGINLLQTNKIHLWKPQNQQSIPKVITTSRTEAFTTNDYRGWFWENEIQGPKSLKELRLLQFDEAQRQVFIQQFSILKLKIQLNDLLQIIDKKQDKDQIFQDVEDIWNSIKQQIQLNIQNGNKQLLLDKTEIQILIKLIKSHQNIISFNQELETSFTKIVQKLWHQNLYNQSIQQMNLNELLDNPFMLNIIIEVIPLINGVVSKPNNIKQYFITNFQNLYTSFLQDLIKKDQNIQLTQDQVKLIYELLDNKNKQKNEIIEIWEKLINNNFFSNWSIYSTYEETIDQLKTLDTLFQFPFQEDFLIILYKSLKSKKLTVYDFFQIFIEQYVEIQRQKLIYTNDIIDQNQFEQDIYQYAIKLASLMFQRQETIIERKPQGILFRDQSQDPYLKFFEDADQFGNYRKQIRKCLPLRQKGNYFQFHHKSIQEFLFAKQSIDMFIESFTQINYIKQFISYYRQLDQQLNFDQIDFFLQKQNLQLDEIKQQEILTKIILQLRDSILNQINLQDTFNLGSLKFIRARFIQEVDLCRILELFVLLSSINQQYLRLSSNCMIILLSVQEYQLNKDFSKIRISDISLDGAIFQQCDLSYSIFEKVSIKGLNFNYSDISNCEWNKMYSYELPSINLQGGNCFSWISPKQNQLLTFTQDGPTQEQIQIWDYQSGTQIQTLKNSSVILYAQYSNTGEFILSYEYDNTIRLWNTKTYTQIKEKKINEKFQRFLFSEDDQKIAFCSNNRIQIINNIENMQFKTIQLQECLGFVFDQNSLISLSYLSEKQVILKWWDTLTGAEIKMKSQEIIEPEKKIYSAIFKNDFIFMIHGIQIEKWDIKEFKQQGLAFKGHSGQITFMDVSKNGQLLVSCSRDKKIIVYDIKSCTALQTLIGHKQLINIVQFSPKANFLVSCSKDQEVRFWDLKFNNQLQNQKIKEISFSPDGKQILSIQNNQILFFSTQTGLQTNIIIEKYQIKCIGLHPSGSFLLYSNETEVKINDIRLLRQVGESKIFKGSILQLGYSSDGNKIFIALDFNQEEQGQLIKNHEKGGLVEIYNLQWEQIHNFNCSPFKTITISSNNEYLMDFDVSKKFRCAISLFELKTFQTKVVYNDQEFTTFCLSNDCQQFIGLEFQNILKIWEFTEEWKLIKKTRIEYYQIYKLLQSNDKKYILCGSVKGDILKFNPQTEKIEKIFYGYQTEIGQLIFSKNELFFTALSKYPVLILWQRDQDSPEDYFIAKYINPNRISQSTLMYQIKFENVKITSYLDYDIGKLFQKKLESLIQRKQNDEQNKQSK